MNDYVVEIDVNSVYKLDYRSWNIDRLDRSVMSNYNNLIGGTCGNVWMVVATAPSRERAEELRDQMIRTLIDLKKLEE